MRVIWFALLTYSIIPSVSYHFIAKLLIKFTWFLFFTFIIFFKALEDSTSWIYIFSITFLKFSVRTIKFLTFIVNVSTSKSYTCSLLLNLSAICCIIITLVTSVIPIADWLYRQITYGTNEHIIACILIIYILTFSRFKTITTNYIISTEKSLTKFSGLIRIDS